jgi:hypothetical protein
MKSECAFAASLFGGAGKSQGQYAEMPMAQEDGFMSPPMSPRGSTAAEQPVASVTVSARAVCVSCFDDGVRVVGFFRSPMLRLIPNCRCKIRVKVVVFPQKHEFFVLCGAKFEKWMSRRFDRQSIRIRGRMRLLS